MRALPALPVATPRHRALTAALQDGDPQVAREVLGPWRFTEDPEVTGRLLAHLQRVCPEPDALSRLLGALFELGWRVEFNLRRAVAEHPWAADHHDEAVRAWRAWFAGDPWGERRTWEALTLPAVRLAFGGVLDGCAAAERTRVLADLRDGWFYRCLGPRDGAPGWVELAVRVIETAPAGSIGTLARLLDADGWRSAATGAVHRGSLASTLALAWPEDGLRATRACKLAARGLQDPDLAERAVDLHLLLRALPSLLEQQPVEAIDPILVQNRGRARGRLRALLLSLDPAPLQAALLALPSLGARTFGAAYTFGWDWGRLEQRLGFPFGPGGAVTPPCQTLHPSVSPLDDAQDRAVQCWVLLVVLRGHLDRLRAWVQTGSTGDRDTRWGDLLAHALPAALRDPPGPSGGRATYCALRAWLGLSLETTLHDLAPTLAAIAALDPARRDLGDRLRAVLQPIWDPSVPPPRGRFTTVVSNARDCRMALASEEP